MIAHLFMHGQKASRTQRIIAAALLLLLALAATAVIGWETYRAAQDTKRIPAPARITLSQVLVDSTSRHHRDRPYKFDVHYAATISGIERPARGYDRDNGSTDDAAEMYALARKYPVGRQVTCYVNSNDGSDTILRRPEGATWYNFALAAAMIATAAMVRWICIPMVSGAERHISPRRAQRNNTLVLLTATALVTAAAVWLFALPVYHAIDVALRWKPTRCDVVSSNLISSMVSGGEAHFTAYRPDVLYRYTIDGRTYHSNQFNYTDFGTPWEGGKRGLIAPYQAGATSTCYVNPADPAHAVLTRDIRPTLAFGLFPVAMIPLFIYGWHRDRVTQKYAGIIGPDDPRELPDDDCVYRGGGQKHGAREHATHDSA